MKTRLLVLLLAAQACATPGGRGGPFVSLQDVVPGIRLDIRYFSSHNFVGRPVNGYGAPKCLLTRRAAEALRGAQAEFTEHGLSLTVFDCYRPQRAVDDFAAWAKDLVDERTKKEFYPNVAKSALFRDGYIAEKSGHSRGSTVDLTLDGLDMGTAFDHFDPLAHTASAAVGPEPRRNRLLLKAVMEKHGFKNLPEEWWHYTLKEEPYPGRYFDLPVE